MKRRTPILIVAAAGLAVAATLASLRLPVVQRHVALRALGGVPGLAVELEHVSAGLGGAELRGVVVRTDAMVLRLPSAQVRYSGWPLLTRRVVEVSELTATDWVLELAADPQAAPKSADAAAKQAAQAFAGFLAPLQLPAGTRVDSVQVGGRIQVSETQTLECSAQGKLFVPGSETTTDLHLVWADRSESSPFPHIDWVGRLVVRTSAAGAVDQVSLDGSLAVPAGQAGAPDRGLATRLAVAKETTGAETLALSVGFANAKDDDAPLVQATLVHKAGEGRVEGEWSLALRREQLVGVADIERLPELKVESRGRFGADLGSGDFNAEGTAAVTGSRFQRWRKDLAAMGTVVGNLDFAAERKGDVVRLGRAAATLNGDAGQVFKLTALQPVGYNLASQTIDFANPAQDLVCLELNGLPLVWLQPWLGEMALGGSVSGGDLRIKGAGENWAVETAAPIAFSGVRIGLGRTPLADRIGGTLALKSSVANGAVSVEKCALALNSDGGAPFDTLSATLSGSFAADGTGKVNLPLVLTKDGRRSDLALVGDWSMAASDRRADVRVTGGMVYLNDLGALAALVPTSPETAAAPTKAGAAKSAAVAKDARAFWTGVAGKIAVDIQKLVLESETVTGLRAQVVCDEKQLALERLEGRAGNAALTAKFGITFDAAKSVPYVLGGSCAFPGFDLGAWMRAMNPGEEPAIETVLDITAKLDGQGTNLGTLIDSVRGDFVLKGGPGVLRIKDERVQAASELGGLVLGLLSKKTQEKPAVVAGSELLAEMREFRFEQFTAAISRGDDMDLQFKTIDVRSTEKRLSGTGLAKHIAGRTIDDYPLRLEMTLAGQGNFGALLDKANLLDGTKDDLGYFKMRQSFVVGGTVGEPDWKKMLVLFSAGIGAGLLGGR